MRQPLHRMIDRPTSRREFLGATALGTAALGLAGLDPFGLGRAIARDETTGPMEILVLGGTGQTGPHLVRQLLEHGHTVTLFNRGRRSEELFPEVECIVGDRALDAEDGLAALEAQLADGRTWDLCIDIWPHIPLIVENTATLLRDHVGHFMFVSSMGVYIDNETHDGDENTPVGEAPNADETEYSDELFGPFKAECENRVRRIYPDRHTIFRPGLIVGPRDFSFRGGYWPVRVRRGGDVFAPGVGSDPVQLVDARDLAAFERVCMEKGIQGTFNVTGPHPDSPLDMRGLLETCREASGSDARFVWADQEFLTEHGVGPWRDMPCWLPGEGSYAGFCRRNVDKAVAAGLTFRPLAETVRDTLTWFDALEEERRAEVAGRVGLTAEREAELLAAWHERQG